jgi:Ca2+-binding EF-hand superfamily protein
VLALVGFAAAYGAYIVYSTYTSSSASSPPALARRNAVHHRRRPNPPRSRVVAATPAAAPDVARPMTEDDLAGFDDTVDYGPFRIFNAYGDPVVMQLRASALPDAETLSRLFGLDARIAHLEVGRIQLTFMDRFLAMNCIPDRLNFPWSNEGMRIFEAWFTSRGLSRQTVRDAVNQYVVNGPHEVLMSMERGLQLGDDADALSGTEVESRDQHGGHADPEGQNLKQLLYYIAEEQSRQEGYIHRGVTCNACDIKPIRGTRWRCSNCTDFDLCSDCHAVGMHPRTHIFYEVKIPAPFLGNPRDADPVTYPGKPHLMPRFLTPDLCKRFVADTNFEKAEVEGLYDQFTCLASYQWENDPNKLGAAIDRSAFEKAFVPLTSINPPRPNLIYDRMFAFYDANGDGLVGFEEFLKGLACIHEKSNGSDKLRKVFEGYDVDADGFVSRKDFLRMFRAFYAIQKEIARDLLAVQAEELTVAGAMDTIMSSQPLSAAFTEAQIPPGDRDAPVDKTADRFGDRRSAHSPVRENEDDAIERETIIGHSWESQANFPFVEETGEPLSASHLRLHTERNGKLTEQREVRFLHNGQSIPEARDEAVRERWRRREFYTDEEEGFYHDHIDDIPDLNGDGDKHHVDLPSPAIRQTLEGSRPVSPRSRSSSKVRFQDDVEFETRSNASTSSRPFNERYGGYEVPEAEKDFGKEILYQVVEDGMNELLDTLFKAKEDVAMEAFATRFERRRWRKEIAAFNTKKQKEEKQAEMEAQDPLMATAAAADAMIQANAEESAANDARQQHEEAEAFRRVPPQPTDAWEIMAPINSELDILSTIPIQEAVASIEQRVTQQSLDDLLQETGYSALPNENHQTSESIGLPHISQSDVLGHSFHREVSRPVYDRESHSLGPATDPPYLVQTYERAQTVERRDPTFPQFRPNSENVDMERAPLYLDPTQEHFLGRHMDEEETARDPTMPQNRPDTADGSRAPDTSAQRQKDEQVGHTAGVILTWTNKPPTQSAARNNPSSASTSIPTSTLKKAWQTPTEARLAQLSRLEAVDREAQARGGPARLSFEEFEAIMQGKNGRSLGFVEGWLELGSF